MTAINSFIASFIRGSDTDNNNVSLYLQNNIETSGIIDLFTHGYSSGNSYIDLFVEGAIANDSSVTLYEYGHDYSSGDISLFIKNERDNDADSITLFIDSHTDQSGEIPLYIECTTPSLPINSYATLFLQCEPFTASQSVNLYIENWSASGDISLYIRGLGFRKGWYAANDNISLFINRVNEVAVMPLFCRAIDGESNSYIEMFIEGTEVITDNITLAMPSTCTGHANSYIFLHTFNSVDASGDITLYTYGKDVESSSIPLFVCHNGGLSNSYCVLYVRGANISEDSISLAIPNTYDIYSDTLHFYTSGW
jgi:hypothetical protein